MREYKWHFPKTEGGVEQGFEDSSMTHFKSDPHYYIARETIQNALDAREDEANQGEPVVVEFKLFKADVSDAIPNLDEYQNILEQNLKSNSNNPSAKRFFKRAIEISKQKSLNILSISDANTVGVKDINKDKGRWHGLIKMVGKGSQEQRNMGGTFGIGKAAPFVCSELRTVFYNTINKQNESAFIWKSIFTTHGSPKRQGYGFFCDYSVKDGETIANGLQTAEKKPSFADRNYNGTDLFIIGFRKPISNNNQPWNVLIEKAIMNNYFASLYDNELRIIIKDEIAKKNYEINSSNVIQNMKTDYNINKLKQNYITNYPYLDAYTDKTNQVVRDLHIEGLGKCKMYLKLDKDYPRRVAYMRLPKMVVEIKSNPRLKTGYAALFICDNKNGNKFLSKCEDPTHKEWNAGWSDKPEKAKTILFRISKEINSVLASLITETYDKETILSGLEQFTYTDESDSPIESDGDLDEDSGDGEDGFTLDELEIETHDLDFIKPNPEKKKKRKKKVKTEEGFGTGEGNESGTGGGGTNETEGGDTTGSKGFGHEEGGKGEHKFKKLPKTRYAYKCFQRSGENTYNLVISTKFEEECHIRIFSQGIDTQRNESINLVKALDMDTGKELNTNGNLINNVETNNNPKTIEITTEENRKLGMEVELYA